MKIYKFYLYMDDDERREMDIKYNKTSKFTYFDFDDSAFVLYAWTDKKKIRDDFIKMRSDNFILKVDDIDDEFYHKFKVEYKEEYLDYRELRTYDYNKGKYKEINTLMTNDEHLLFTEYIDEHISQILQPVCESEYMYLKDEFIDVLDLFLYTISHDRFYAVDEAVEDLVCYNLGYGLTPNGNHLSKIYDSIDQFRLFVHTFRDFFK